MKTSLYTVKLHDQFYQDGIRKVIWVMMGIVTTVGLLLIPLIYLLCSKPQPVSFAVDAEWHIQPSVPLEQRYMNNADLLQWVSEILPRVFTIDFNHYHDQLQGVLQYFTSNGWKNFLNQLNIYANYNNVQRGKTFINSHAAGAPFIVNEGLLSGRYAWWVQMPIDISYTSGEQFYTKSITLQVLVARVSTLNNLNGIGIDNVIVVKAPGIS